MASPTIQRSTKRKSFRVEAPADLEEGFTFDVMVEGRPVKVEVPEGGVAQGETFDIPYDLTDVRPSSSDSEEIAVVGRWRTPLCGCCDVITQSTFWMGFFCLPVLVAQILTRLGLNWKGLPDKDKEETQLTYNKIVLAFVVALIIGNVPSLGILSMLCFSGALMLWTGRNLRRHVRERYEIPTTTKLDDCFCAFFCSCCSVIQMARQTHDDKEYPGYCCTTTGLEPGAPLVV